ncbi:MAG: PLD nuclease N-terminal domain-containing protein [Microbacterium sp.]
MSLVFTLLMLAFTVLTVVDIITRDEWQVKHLPKFVWLLIAILLPTLGGILWWVLGREYPERQRQAPATGYPAAPYTPPPVDTRSTEQQIADLEREIEEDKRRRGEL